MYYRVNRHGIACQSVPGGDWEQLSTEDAQELIDRRINGPGFDGLKSRIDSFERLVDGIASAELNCDPAWPQHLALAWKQLRSDLTVFFKN